jgi:phosphoribosyl 1,2-cyclic phosphodiesterase
MRITIACVATGSTGNAYILNVGGRAKILLDAGVPLSKIRTANGNRIQDIAAALITHIHDDHAKAVPELKKQLIPLIYQFGRCCVRINNCHVTTFEQSHDVECIGFGIHFRDKNNELITIHYITDTVKINAPNANDEGKHYYIIECDYTVNRMNANNNNLSAAVALRNQRTMITHLSDDTVVKFLASVPFESALFVHMSRLNFDADELNDKMSTAGIADKCKIAEAGQIYIWETGNDASV